MSKVNEAVRALRHAISDEVAARVARAVGKKRKPDGRARRDMRCQYTDKQGRRCTQRSKGPRFKYRCVAHLVEKRARVA
jgi:hypothetical protein